MNGLIGASVMGAVLMYVLDPQRGRRRRARMRDKLVSAGTALRRGADVTLRDARNRASGQVARLRSLVAGRSGSARTESSPRDGALPFMQASWSPTQRLVAGIGGLGLLLSGVRTPGLTGGLLTAGGLALFLRSATNLELQRLTGIGAGRRAITLQKTITVAASPAVVFEFWRRYENFPRFMAHVREVRLTDGERSHWVVAGPAGVSIEWDTEETANRPNELLAWRTVPGSVVDHAGVVRFEPVPGGTRVHVRMSYTPPAGAIGHAVLALLGSDPKTAMDADLVRFKSLLEDGKTTAHGDTVERREIAS